MDVSQFAMDIQKGQYPRKSKTLGLGLEQLTRVRVGRVSAVATFTNYHSSY